MGEWHREAVAWAQGQLLSQTDVQRLGLSLAEQPDATLVLIISHDCDIANDMTREPDVEIVVGHIVAMPDPNNLFAKNPRLLELPFQGTKVFCARFNVHTRRNLSKEELLSCTPDAASLEQKSLQVLQAWLASRYKRPAFPDDFDQHLKDADLHKRLKKLGEIYGHLVSGLLFDLRPKNGGYELGIAVLYVTGSDPLVAFKQAEQYAKGITKAFEKKFFDHTTETWQFIELMSCDPISEDDLTFSQARNYQRWNLDAVSYAADPQQASIPD